MQEQGHHSRTMKRPIPILGLLGILAVPTTGRASVPEVLETNPIAVAAADDPDCEESTVKLEVDVATGLVYLVDPDTSNLILTDNDINVYFGELGDVLVIIHYTSSNWAVTVTPDEDPPVTYNTTNGWVRYSIAPEFDEYVFHSSEVTSMSAMSAMVPVLPDIIIRPRKMCPPPP
jgi:hypothetical protein